MSCPRRIRHINLRTIYPCCIRKFCSGDAAVRLLAKAALITHHRLKSYLDNDIPTPDNISRKLEEATLGVLKAHKVPRDTTAREMYSAPPFARGSQCSCKYITPATGQ